jgi:hypothetical protein
MTSRPSTAAPILAVLAIALPLAYAGSYLALVDIRVVRVIDSGVEFEGQFLRYRFGGELAESVFYPLNQVDRWLRPEKWQYVLNPSSSLSGRLVGPAHRSRLEVRLVTEFCSSERLGLESEVRFRFQISDFRFQISDFKFQISNLRSRS